MKIFIMTDLEGATCVAGKFDDIFPGGREHESAKRFLTGDVNAAIEGAVEGGAVDIVVLDGHGPAFSVIPEDLEPRAQIIRGRRSFELEGLDESFDLMLAVGAHSMAGTPNGLLAHTIHQEIEGVWVNGRPVGEIGLWATLAGHYSIPVGLVTGDLAAVREAGALLGKIETAAVKEATSMFAARCLHPQVAQGLIREAAKRATMRAGEFRPYKPKVPIEFKVQYMADCDFAEKVSRRKGVVKIDERTLSCRGDNILEMYNTLIKKANARIKT